MKAEYKDITSRIKKDPKWYDDNGTPRYCKFHPDRLPDIYAVEGILLEIQCQHCGRHFIVGISWSKQDGFLQQRWSFSKMLKNQHIPGYGDPPIHGCIGDTETSDSLRIVEFWKKNAETNYEWERIKENEIKFENL